MYVQPIYRFVLTRVFNSVLFVATAIAVYVIREKLDERKEKRQKMDGSILPPGAVQGDNQYKLGRE